MQNRVQQARAAAKRIYAGQINLSPKQKKMLDYLPDDEVIELAKFLAKQGWTKYDGQENPV